MKYKNKIATFTILPILSLMPVIAIACNRNDFNAYHDNFVMQKNYANKAGDFSYAYSNSYDNDLKDINLATGSKLFRISSENQPTIDFRDNIVLKPTELRYKFEYVQKLTLHSLVKNKKNEEKEESVTYNSDKVKQVSYQESLTPDPDTYYPKKDKGQGFTKPYLFVPSGKENSINHPSFLRNLRKTKKIEMNFSDSYYSFENKWVDYQGKKTKYKTNARDFLLGIIKSAFQNKKFRDEYYKKNNMTKAMELEEKQYDKNNPYFNGPDIVSWLESYNVNANKLLDIDNLKKDVNSLSIESLNDKYVDFVEFFKNAFLYSNYFDGMPSQYLFEKYNTTNLFTDKTINWFYEYGRNYKDRLYSSYYYIAKNNNNETILYRNKEYTSPLSEWQNKPHLNEIVYRYNPIPINNDTFNVQMLNAFKQNIISNLEIDKLNQNQKEEILSKFSKYNLNYSRMFEKYKSHTSIINNHFPYANNFYFNNNFAKLYYGKSIEELKTGNSNLNEMINSEIMTFQSLINNIINPYGLGLANGNYDVWMSQAPTDLNVISNNQDDTNYTNLKDAQANINKQIILQNKNDKIEQINTTTQYDNKLHNQNSSSITNSDLQLRSVDFELIKNELKKIIDDYYLKNPNSEKIEWVIPILAFNLTKSQLQILSKIKQEFKNIHEKLEPKTELVDDYDKYFEYFTKNKSIYKENKFILNKSDTSEFIKEMIFSNNLELLFILNSLSKYTIGTNVYQQLGNIIKEYKNKYPTDIDFLNKIQVKNINNLSSYNQNIANLKKGLIEILNSLKTKDVIQLINEINNLVSYTISLENKASLINFSKVLYQKFIEKPIAYDGLNYLQDILINRKVTR
ncbi:OppA family ABC transporter substrate-binding lipoprotein [Metamycoplasma buccale]|uniref:OppA family ABC transporter substrate-binding lipoprotein n=1 Tax=Metamycoplasma buccale TaxID=55602 RepID=UPI00398EB163